MTALLGLLAVAGYQHRDKLAELLEEPHRAVLVGKAKARKVGWVACLAAWVVAGLEACSAAA
jgi:hypothetical protein